MYDNRGGYLFDTHGLPIWEYTKEPIRLKLNK